MLPFGSRHATKPYVMNEGKKKTSSDKFCFQSESLFMLTHIHKKNVKRLLFGFRLQGADNKKTLRDTILFKRNFVNNSNVKLFDDIFLVVRLLFLTDAHKIILFLEAITVVFSA